MDELDTHAATNTLPRHFVEWRKHKLQDTLYRKKPIMWSCTQEYTGTYTHRHTPIGAYIYKYEKAWQNFGRIKIKLMETVNSKKKE